MSARTLTRTLRMMPIMRPTLILAVLLTGSILGSQNTRASSHKSDNPAGELMRLRASIHLAEKNQRPETLLQELRRLRELQIHFGAVDSALSTCLRVVGLSGVSEDRIEMAKDWQALSTVARRSGDLSGAVAAAKRRVILLKTTGNHELEAVANLELLDLLFDSKRYAEFKHQSEALLNSFEREKNVAGHIRVLYRQGEYLTSKGRAADALSLLHSALRSREVLANDREVARILFALSNANAHIKNWTVARNAFAEAEKLAPDAPDGSPELYGLLARIHEGQGEMDSALRYLRKEALTKDSLFSASIADRAVRMQMLYAVQAKEKDVTDLREENEAAASRLLVEQAKTRWSLVICAALTVGMLVLLLLRFRQTNSVRRTRLKNVLITGRVKQVEAKGLELERENLHLAQALMHAKERRSEISSRSNLGADEIQLVDLLIRTQMQHVGTGAKDTGLVALHSRIKTMDLVNSNLVKAEKLGVIQLRAHFTALVNALLTERNASASIRVSLDLVEEEKDLVDDLLPLSLMLNELLQISIDQASVSGNEAGISISLRRVAHQYELLYTDHSEAIDASVIHNGALGTEILLALADAMDGSILLLKSDVTTFQFTFEPSATVALRKAS